MRKLRAALRSEMHEYGQTVRREFEGVVSDWSPESKPRFTVEERMSDRGLVVIVRPYARRKASRIFGWVDRGTRPHVIRPRPENERQLLFFRTGYRAKTKPIAQAHVGDGKATGPWVAAREVHHPGTKPRRFSEEIRKRTVKRFRRRVEAIFRKYARRYGA